MKTDTGGSAYPRVVERYISSGGFKETNYVGGMTLLDAAALAALPDSLDKCASDKDAVICAYEVGVKFIAEKRRREGD